VRAASHILHGCANVLKGTLEAIPIVGAVIAVRSIFLLIEPDWGIGQGDKILGYAKLLPTIHGDRLLTRAEFTV